eukprot:Mrub_13183.p2 GENE.Mrub_13183~~Mrub_13183.p2  ORF type:complete len:146 (+),score=30.09 Mrub_13183:46-438(+)
MVDAVVIRAYHCKGRRIVFSGSFLCAVKDGCDRYYSTCKWQGTSEYRLQTLQTNWTRCDSNDVEPAEVCRCSRPVRATGSRWSLSSCGSGVSVSPQHTAAVGHLDGDTGSVCASQAIDCTKDVEIVEKGC